VYRCLFEGWRFLMRGKALAATVAAGGFAWSALAFAAPPPGKGKPPATGAGCRPQVMLVVKGTAVADATVSALSLTVSGGNHVARVLFANDASTLVTVTTTATTKVRNGAAHSTSLASIKKGDRVLVQYRLCKSDLKNAASTPAAFAGFLAGQPARLVIDLGTGND
jgi:hypothetical protein